MNMPLGLQGAPASSETEDGPVFSRLDIAVPLALLQREVSQLLDRTWQPHVNREDYSGGWDVMPLRCQKQHVSAHPILQGFALHAATDDWCDLPALQQCLSIRQLLDQLECPLKSVRLMRLHAGASIRPHRDRGLHLGCGEARLHIPVWTNPDVHFIVAGQEVPMRAGEAWYFNADKEHAVINHSQEARTHLVMDCVTTPWLVRRIQEGALDA